VYSFACHPILGVNGDGNTADIAGFASHVIEETLGEGTIALFVQGCGGDINPIRYKDVNHPRHGDYACTTLLLVFGLSMLVSYLIDKVATRRRVKGD
jgi:hypothetical protein